MYIMYIYKHMYILCSSQIDTKIQKEDKKQCSIRSKTSHVDIAIEVKRLLCKS